MPHTNHLAYEFGPYRFSLAQRALTRDGEIISLTPKAFEILTRLVVNAGQLLEKDDLLREVWPDTFVEEANLTQYIFTLRRALGDERAGPRYIETVSRRGYRFVADVRVCEGEAPAVSSAGTESETQPEADDESAPRPVVAVLPFVNETGDEGLEYLAEGVTDNLINNLSRVSRMRVMSRSAVFRRNAQAVDPQTFGKELGATAVLVGKITSRPATLGVESGLDGSGVKAVLGIKVELVEVATGWLIWGESFDCESRDLLQIQDAITRQLLVNLKLKLTGEEEKRVTARYTENAQAYQAYLEGRYHWSRYTRKGIETAIKNFRRAIELDSNYALAYAAIVDCYLRLATNYLPPDVEIDWLSSDPFSRLSKLINDQPEQRIKLRFKWDWKGVERESRRANELKTHYPSIYQWHVAYQLSKELYGESLSRKRSYSQTNAKSDFTLAPQIPSIKLTPAEEVQILCSIARDQMAIGNYEAASLILRNWAEIGKWPKLEYLNAYAAADLLVTSGTLFGFLAGSKPVFHGHKYAEALLNGSIGLFEHLGIRSRTVEARVELTRCYYRQGLLQIAQQTGLAALAEIPADEMELKTLALITIGVIERDMGFLNESLTKLREAAKIEVVGSLVTGRCHIDLATTLKDLALAEEDDDYLTEAQKLFLRALYESEALGHHRNVASAENNIGFLLLNINLYRESEPHLLHARRVFEGLGDIVRESQVNDTLARLYIEFGQGSLAVEAIRKAVTALELTDSEALLVEALTTKGMVASKIGDCGEAKRSFEAAQKIAERCGDYQGACRALLSLSEELTDYLETVEKIKIRNELKLLVPRIQVQSLVTRIQEHLAKPLPT